MGVDNMRLLNECLVFTKFTHSKSHYHAYWNRSSTRQTKKKHNTGRERKSERVAGIILIQFNKYEFLKIYRKFHYFPFAHWAYIWFQISKPFVQIISMIWYGRWFVANDCNSQLTNAFRTLSQQFASITFYHIINKYHLKWVKIY